MLFRALIKTAGQAVIMDGVNDRLHKYEKWPVIASKDEGWAWIMNAPSRTHIYIYTKACKHSHMHKYFLPLSGPESYNVAEGYERFWVKRFRCWLLITWRTTIITAAARLHQTITTSWTATKKKKRLQWLNDHIVAIKFQSSNSTITITTTNDNNNKVTMSASLK